MSKNKSTNNNDSHIRGKAESQRPLYELAIIMLVTICIGLFIQEIKGILSLLPIVYLFIERHHRKRSWNELGVKKENFIQGVAENWYWFIVVIFIIQISVFWAANVYWPAFINHILSRIAFLNLSPVPDIMGMIQVVGVLLLFTLLEELIYRGLAQERFSWYYDDYAALFLATLLFTAVHYYHGDILIVSIDLLLVFLDSLIYGIIYMKSRSIFVSWTAHFAADIVGITMLLLII